METWAFTHAWTTRALNPSAIIIVSLVLLVTKAALTSAAPSRPRFMAAGGDAQRRCEAVMRVAAKDAANAAMPKLFEMTRRMLTPLYLRPSRPPLYPVYGDSPHEGSHCQAKGRDRRCP
jgi:hypothetical protein